MRKIILQFSTIAFFLTVLLSGSLLAEQNKSKIKRMTAIRNAVQLANRLHPQMIPNFVAPDDSNWLPEEFGHISGHINGIFTDGPVRGDAFAMQINDSGMQEVIGAGIVHDDHSYEIHELPPGEYLVVVSVEGYLPEFYGNTVTSDSATVISLGPGEHRTDIDIDIEPLPTTGASISGIIKSENTNLPLSGARVSAFSMTNPFLFAQASSDSSGFYRLTNLLPGKYIVQADANGFMPEYFDNTASFEKASKIEVTDSLTIPDINFSLQQSSQILGTITLDDGRPLPGVLVFAIPLDSTAYEHPERPIWPASVSSVSDENGHYALDNLLPGIYFVKATYFEGIVYQEQWWSADSMGGPQSPIEVVEGGLVDGIDFVFTTISMEGIIEGYVHDAAGNPLARARVNLESAVNYGRGSEYKTGDIWPGYAYSVFTDENGFFKMRNVPDGDYFAFAYYNQSGRSYEQWWENAQTPADASLITLGGEKDSVSIYFALPVKSFNAVISGYVYDSANQPLNAAWVNVRPVEIVRCYERGDGNDERCESQTTGWAQTDSSGYYEIRGLAAGEYFAHAQYWSGLSYGELWYENATTVENATSISLPEDGKAENINFNIDVHPIYGTIAGVVRDAETGMAIKRAHVELTPVWSDRIAAPFHFWNYAVAVDDSGGFEFSWLPAGDYLVSAYSNGAFAYYPDAPVAEFADTLRVKGGQTSLIEFKMQARNDGSGAISGWIGSQSADLPLDVGVVIARPTVTILSWPDSELFYTAVSNPDGSYELSGLPDGEYLLYGFAANFIPEYYDDVFDPAKAEFVKIESGNPVGGIEFDLIPAYFLERDEAGNPSIGGTAQISGVVFNDTDMPLANANVYLLNDEGEVVAASRTNANGEYVFAGIQNGEYYLQATHFGNASQFNDNSSTLDDAPVLLVNGDVADVDFVLPAGTATSVGETEEVAVPTGLHLLGNYPNPFNPQTKIKFSLGENAHVTLNIYDMLGRKIATLLDMDVKAGEHAITWDARDKNGVQLGTGLYFYQISTVNAVKTGKMILQK